MKNIILVGMMSSGKTTLGKKLARALNYQFVDLDKLIEKDQGMEISAIFSQRGGRKQGFERNFQPKGHCTRFRRRNALLFRQYECDQGNGRQYLPGRSRTGSRKKD